MVRSTASVEDDTPTATHDVQVSPQTTQRDLARVEVNTTTHGVDHGLGLLVNLLLHKVVELALHDGGDFEFESLDGPRGGELGRRRGAGLRADTMDVQFTVGYVGDVVIFEIEDSLSVLDNGSSVGGNEELDGLGETIFRHEGAGLGTGDFVA